MNYLNCQDYYLHKHFNTSLLDVAYAYEYSKENQLILQAQSEDDLFNLDPALYQQLFSQDHCRDSRSPLQFAKQMVSNWIWEDVVQSLLSSDEIFLENNGTDADRTFSGYPTNKSDFVINYNGQDYNVELQISYSSTLSTFGSIPVRDKKYLNMQKDKDFFLIVDLYQDNISFTLIDMTQPTNATYSDSIANYNKPGYYLDVSDRNFYYATSENFKNMFIDCVNDRNSIHVYTY